MISHRRSIATVCGIILGAILASSPAALARSRKGKPPASKVEAVKVIGKDVTPRTLKAGRSSSSVYLVTPTNPIRLDAKLGGKLALTFYRVLGANPPAAAVVTVVIDGAERTVSLGNAAQKGASLTGTTGAIGAPKAHQESLGKGNHSIELRVVDVPEGVAVKIELTPTGSKKPAPLVSQAEAGGSLLSSLSLDDDDEDDEDTPTPPPPDPTPVVEATPPPPPDPEPTPEPTPTPVVEPTPPVAPAPKGVKERIAAGEIRDGLLADYPTVAVVDDGTPPTTTELHRVDANRTYDVMVEGPGKLTVRVHALLGSSGDAATLPDYTIVILQNDVVLQQLTGKAEVATTLRPASPMALAGLRLATPREYRLTIPPGRPRLAFQMAQAAGGMLARYTFEAEKAALSALSIDLGDEDDEDGIAAAPAPAIPISIMEVDLTTTAPEVILVEAPSFLNLGFQLGTVLPAAGGNPGISGAAELRFTPFGAFALGVRGGAQLTSLHVRVGDAADTNIDVRTAVIAVPVLGVMTARLKLGEDTALSLAGAGGIVWMRANRESLGASQVETGLTWAVRAGLGIETAAGPGFIGLNVGYLYTPIVDLGAVLRDFTPGGPTLALAYRLSG